MRLFALILAIAAAIIAVFLVLAGDIWHEQQFRKSGAVLFCAACMLFVARMFM